MNLCSFRYYGNGKGVVIWTSLRVLRTLRNFGCAISNLVLCLDFRPDISKKVDLYVVKYCSKSIQTLRIISAKTPQNVFKSVENPFIYLKKLSIQGCQHESNLWRFEAAVFPNLQSLKLYMNWMVPMVSQRIEFQKFPLLKCFSFDGTMEHYNDMRNYTDIVEMIKLNSQLEKFEIVLIEHFDQQHFGVLMQCIIDYLPNLQCLNLIFSGPDSVFNVIDSYHFDNVTDFGLFNIPSTFSTKVPFTFPKLKRLTITTADKTFTEHLNHAHIWDFIANNKDLTSIFLHGNVNGTLITNYEHVFSNVEELYMSKCHDIPIDTVLKFMKNRLKKHSISGTKKSMEKHLYQDFCEILKVNEIEFREVKPKHRFFNIGLELIIKRMSDFSFMGCYFECRGSFINGNESDVIFYSNSELECYMPTIINPYYAHYHIGEKLNYGFYF